MHESNFWNDHFSLQFSYYCVSTLYTKIGVYFMTLLYTMSFENFTE